MKKAVQKILGMALITMTSVSFAATLTSLNKTQVEQAFVGKTLVSIPTDNLNGKTINNTFSMFMDNHGHIWGSMSQKPVDEPRADEGVYSIKQDGTVYMTWNHWDGAKQLCFHSFATANAYLNVGCDQVFHTAFMKADVVQGDHLN